MRRLANACLTLLMLLGLVVIATVTLVPAITGTQAITIDRASMQRDLAQGSLALIKRLEVYQLHDIVTYQHNGNTVTHEIVELLPNPANAKKDGLWLQTKGTENAENDPFIINKSQVLGKVETSIPVAGMVLNWIGYQTTQMFLILLAISLFWIGRPLENATQRMKRRLTTYAAPTPLGRTCHGCLMATKHGPGKGF